jgi:hypothetical protein
MDELLSFSQGNRGAYILSADGSIVFSVACFLGC